jgi:hypothetical protein
VLVMDYLDKHCSGQNICVLSYFDSAFIWYDWFLPEKNFFNE